MDIKEEDPDILLRQTSSEEEFKPQDNNSKSHDIGQKKLNESNFDLLDLLNSCEDGKMLLSTYSTLSHFTYEDRIRLAILVLNHEPDHKRPSRQRVHFLAEKIVEIFPTEKKEVWVTDIISSAGTMTIEGIFSKSLVWRDIAKGLGKNIQDCERDLLKLTKKGHSKYGKGKTKWKEIWSTVEENWSNTTKIRLQKLYFTKDIFLDYFRKYSFLSEPMGYSLLERDFEYLYPTAKPNLFAEWPKLSIFFEKIFKERTPLSLADFTSPDARMLTILNNLAWIFPVMSVRKTSGIWCPTRWESQLSFLLLIKSYEHLWQFVNSRNSKIVKVGVKNLPPLPVVIGNEETFEKCFVVLDRVKYEVDNPLKAIDLTFKIFHSLHLPYPPECAQIWTFLQQAVYKIYTKSDKKHPITDELIAKYQNFEIYVR